MQPLNSITENKGNAVMYQGSDASPRLQNSAQGENEDILIDFLRYANQKDPNAFPIMGNAALWGGSEKAAEPAEVSGASAGGGSNVVTFPFQEKEMSERSVLIQPLDACCPENENLLSVLYHNTDKGYLILSLDENDHILIKGGNRTFSQWTGISSGSFDGAPAGEISLYPEAIAEHTRCCIRQNKRVEVLKNYGTGDLLERWRAVFLPFLGQDGERMAVCQMENITKEYKRDKAIQMLEEENKCLSETTVSAIAMIRMGQGKPFYEKYNQAYERFQKLYQTCCSADSYIQWIKKLESLSKPATFQFSLPIDKKKPLCYTATLVPVIVEEKLEKIFVTITDAKTHVVLTGQTMDCLTKREKEVLEMAAQGCSNKHIALELAVTEGTIKKQLSSGYDKLGISSRTELVKFYLDYVERETK